MKRPRLHGLIRWIKIKLKCLNYSKRLMAKMKQVFGFKDGAFFSCHARFFLVLIRALNGAFPTIFL